MDFKIRKAGKEDIPKLAVLFDDYRVFYHKISDINGAIVFLSNRLSKGDSEIFISENDAKVLMGFVQLYPLFSSTRMKRLWLLNDLFVDKNYRGKGISKKLIDQAKVLVKDTNACGMLLETGKTNDIGNQLYPRTGFKLNEASNFYEWYI